MPMERWLSATLVQVVLLAWLSPVKAQTAPPPPRLILSAAPIEKAPPRDADLRPSALRPNVTQEILTYVQNDGPQARKVRVQLVAGGVVVASQPAEVASGKLVPVPWPGAPPASVAPAVPPARAPSLAQLTPPVAFRLVDETGQALGKDVVMEVDRPSYYLDAEMEFVPARGQEKNRLLVRVTPNRYFKGPRCPVQLMLDPERIPGFIAGQKKKGVYAGFVTGERLGNGLFRPLYLVAEDIQLTPDKRDGVVTLQADGYSRAFTFRATFAPSGTRPRPQERSKESLRLDVPPAADPRKPLRVVIEADNLEQPADARLVLDVLTVVMGDPTMPQEQFSPLAEFRGERNVQMFYAAGGRQGGLRFRAEVTDWITEQDLGGLHGPATLRLRLLDRDNKPREVLHAESGQMTTEFRRTVVLDDTPPEDVRFTQPPTSAIRTRPLVLSATGMDPESGIRDVVFFLGKLPPNAALPPDIIAAPGVLPRRGRVWSATLVVPADARPVLDVSVRFTNPAGLSTTEVIQLAVTDPAPAAKGPKLASIAGTVTEGDRTQRELPVQLQDTAGKVLAKTNTDAKGAYLFKDLAAGDYQVSAEKVASATKGTIPVKLAAGEEKKGVVVKLWR
jgi:hypothetical protein